MAVSLIPVLIIAAAVGLLVLGLAVLSRRQNRGVTEAVSPTTATLRYQVPEGQDPVAVLTALRGAGYDAVAEQEFVTVSVLADSADERDRVRAVIQEAGINIENPSPPGSRVRFADE